MPGLIGFILMITAVISTSLSVVQEREIGTMEQLLVTPIQSWQLILGKLAPFTLIGLIDITLVVLVTTFWFDIPVRGSVPLLFGLCSIFLLTTLGLGLFVSTVSRTQQQAMMTAVFLVIIRGLFLRGVGIGELWDEALALFIFGMVILAMSISPPQVILQRGK